MKDLLSNVGAGGGAPATGGAPAAAAAGGAPAAEAPKAEEKKEEEKEESDDDMVRCSLYIFLGRKLILCDRIGLRIVRLISFPLCSLDSSRLLLFMGSQRCITCIIYNKTL